MKNITILLPLHKLDEVYGEMLSNCLSSMDTFYNDVILSIICPKEVNELLKDFDFGQKLEVKIIENNTGKTDFISQINLGIDECTTKWFSILEVDDEYLENWLKFGAQYIKSYSDVDIFLPIVLDINKSGEVIGYSNETAWAYGFTSEVGYIDNETLLEFQNFQTSGGLFKTQKIKNIGKLKDNIKLTFMYEFLLRVTQNNLKTMVIPRILYKHVNFREDSLFWLYKNDENQLLSEEEVKKWVSVAKTEFYFKNKRELTE